jgi:hypothetical protein
VSSCVYLFGLHVDRDSRGHGEGSGLVRMEWQSEVLKEWTLFWLIRLYLYK